MKKLKRKDNGWFRPVGRSSYELYPIEAFQLGKHIMIKVKVMIQHESPYINTVTLSGYDWERHQQHVPELTNLLMDRKVKAITNG